MLKRYGARVSQSVHALVKFFRPVDGPSAEEELAVMWSAFHALDDNFRVRNHPTLGIATGMFWSSIRTGRVWHNDPKEIFALLTWMLYFVLTVYRTTASWRGRRAAWLGVIGFALVLCTFFGARLLPGYHVFG